MARRERWQEDVDRVRRMYTWVLEVEQILAGTDTARAATTNHAVGSALDAWVTQLCKLCESGTLSEHEQRCARHFLKVTCSLRPWLCHCYETMHLPRTNNAMEGFIRRVKARARRMSGRKNWNQYLLRYGSRVVYYEADVSNGTTASLSDAIRRLTPRHWRAARTQQVTSQVEQQKQTRFRRQRAACLRALEQRWVALGTGT